MQIDVFNGDADGICALVQLRLDQPAQSTLVTGVKRDIQLLENLCVQKNDQLTVLDISLKKIAPLWTEFSSKVLRCFMLIIMNRATFRNTPISKR